MTAGITEQTAGFATIDILQIQVYDCQRGKGEEEKYGGKGKIMDILTSHRGH